MMTGTPRRKEQSDIKTIKGGNQMKVGKTMTIKQKVARRISMSLAGIAMSIGTAFADDLPTEMVWTSYDLGSTGFAHSTAIANSLQNINGTRVRIIPSGTGVGRIMSLAQSTAQYGFLSNEALFAAEGTEEFSARNWGPQDLRTVLAPPSLLGVIVPRGSKFADGKDIRGIRLAYVRGNSSLNVKNDAWLAYYGLTRDDIEPVWFGSYGTLKDPLIGGQIDAFMVSGGAGQAREVEASSIGLEWIELDPNDAAAWERVQKIAPMMSGAIGTQGVGMSEEHPASIMSYRTPMLITYADRSEDEVYALTRALHENFGSYKDAHATAPNWAIDLAGHTPADVAWHPGSVRFLQEMGVWTEKDEQWNQRRLAQQQKAQADWETAKVGFDAWLEAPEQAEKASDPDAAWTEYWLDYKANPSF